MGHCCRICGRVRANEKFSGRSHRTHVCKDCKGLPEPSPDPADLRDEIQGYLAQKNISERNIDRLKILAARDNAEVAHWASIVLEVARVKPRKRRRLIVLAEKRPDLLGALEETGLISAHGS